MLFLSTLPASLWCFAQKIENVEFVRGVSFEYIDSLKNNGLKDLLIFDDSCEEISNSKKLVDIATAGRHRGLSTIYIKHNLFHQSKHGRNLELQNAHIVFIFKCRRNVMQVSMLSEQMGLWSSLVDWFWDAISVSYGHLLIDLSPRTDDRLSYCSNTGSIPSKFYIPDRLKQKKFLNDQHTTLRYFSNVAIVFPQLQMFFPSVLPNRFCQVPLRKYGKSSQGKLAKHKKTSG